MVVTPLIIFISFIIVAGIVILVYFTAKYSSNSSDPPTPDPPTPDPPVIDPPSAPIIDSITPSNSQLTINFTAGSDGGSPITNYQYFIEGGIAWSPANTTTSPIIISGLTNGTTYSIKIRAVNIIGEGVSSNIVSGTPANVPSAPIIDSITAANTQLIISFTPGSDRGSPITNYEYSIDDGLNWNPRSPISTLSPLIITGLINGITYSVKIRAVNSIGEGDPSGTVLGIPNIQRQRFQTVGSTTWTAPIGITSIDYLIVAGGGGSGGGFDTGGGGGGGGGMVLSGTATVIPGNTYNVVVGDGGIGGISNRSIPNETNGSQGGNSSFDSIVALGGGGGYASRLSPSGESSLGGPGATTDTASEGGRGGGSAGDDNGAGGGGGGSNGNGSNGLSNTGGNGGGGTSSNIMGTSQIYGAGGRGANGNSTNVAVAGASNTGNGARGGGGGSGQDENGAKGGSGVVIIRY